MKTTEFFVRTVSLLLCALVLIMPVFANSAQVHWKGTLASGALTTDKDCPIEVTSEKLTFNIREFPKDYYQDVEDFLLYTPSVTAKYTFTNPKDYAVDARLVFPLGNLPSYANLYDSETGTHNLSADTEKYTVKVGGESVEKTLRHTYKARYDSEFSFNKESKYLLDSYVDDPFYSPEMTVREYVFTVASYDEEKYPAANVAIKFSFDESKTRLLFLGNSGGKYGEDEAILSEWAELGKKLTVYIIGEQIPEFPLWQFYKNGGLKDGEKISGSMNLYSERNMTLEELLLSNYSENSGVLAHDWYNALICEMNENLWEKGALRQYDLDVSDSLMRWYEYSLSFEGGETLENEVSAPIYPEIDRSGDFPVYTYTYLLSPAQTWASFRNLDVEVISPHYINANLKQKYDFERTNIGYRVLFDRLPLGEMTFMMTDFSDSGVKSTEGFPVWKNVILPIILAVVFFGTGFLVATAIWKCKTKNECRAQS